MTITSVAKEVPRDRFNRPQVRQPDGSGVTPYTRCTTYVGCLEDMWKLHQYDRRMDAVGFGARPDLMLAVQSAGDDKQKLNALCDQAKEAAQASAKANIGTSLHALTERIDRGEELPPGLPENYLADLDAYRRATAHLEALHIEQFVVNDELQVGGTPDRIVNDNGTLKIADVKTGSIEWGMGKIAMQLAMYAHSRFYDPETGERADLGPVDLNEAIVIHLPAGEGRCELVTVDIAAGWEGVQLATAVRAWRKRKARDLSRAYETPALTAASSDGEASAETTDPVNDELANRIASAATVDELGAIWAERHTDFTDQHIELAAARKRLLTTESVA